jgi:hypothetical protein
MTCVTMSALAASLIERCFMQAGTAHAQTGGVAIGVRGAAVPG